MVSEVTNSAPKANNDLAITNINQSIVLNVLANDTDLDNDALSITGLSAVSGGFASIVSGSSTVVVTPSSDSTLPVIFSYSVSDGNGGFASANVNVNIIGGSSGNTTPSTYWTDPNYSIEMIRISSGTFMMGAAANDADEFEGRELPQHQVTITKDFYMGKYEVTQGQWESIMGGSNSWPGTQPSSTYGQSTSHPAYFISWNDINGVNGFLDKLNQASGCDTSALTKDSTRYKPQNVPMGCFRLPTEAEWEYAARAGTTTRFSYGDDIAYTELTNYAWYDLNSDSKGIRLVKNSVINRACMIYMVMFGSWSTTGMVATLKANDKTDPHGPSTGGSHRKHAEGGTSNKSIFAIES